MAPAALAFDHLALLIRDDVAASLRFYRDLLGFSLHSALSGDDWDGHPWLMLLFDLPNGQKLALSALRGLNLKEPPELPRDVRHFAFVVPDLSELAAWQARLQGAGIPFMEEDHGSQKSFYFEDPSGNLLEITTYLPTQEAPDPRGAEALVERWLVAASA